MSRRQNGHGILDMSSINGALPSLSLLDLHTKHGCDIATNKRNIFSTVKTEHEATLVCSKKQKPVCVGSGQTGIRAIKAVQAYKAIFELPLENGELPHPFQCVKCKSEAEANAKIYKTEMTATLIATKNIEEGEFIYIEQKEPEIVTLPIDRYVVIDKAFIQSKVIV